MNVNAVVTSAGRVNSEFSVFCLLCCPQVAKEKTLLKIHKSITTDEPKKMEG